MRFLLFFSLAGMFGLSALVLATVPVAAQQRIASLEGTLGEERGFVRQAPLAVPTPQFTTPSFAENLPLILSPKDRETYKRIFALQKKGQWREADKQIETLKDKVLLGHVLFQRYMHPRAYRSRYKELRAWMKHYRDHPDAHRVYRLAYKRAPKHKRARLPRPARVALPFEAPTVEATGWNSKAKTKRYSRSESRTIYRIQRFVHRKRVTYALQYLRARKKSLRAFAYAKATVPIVAGYLLNGYDEKALYYAEEQVRTQGAHVLELHWWAGLASFRLERFERAAWHFEQLAVRGGNLSNPFAARAGYWGSRAYLHLGKPDHSSRLLKIAHAHQPHSFYGQLATEALGYKSLLNWTRFLQEKTDLADLLSFPAGRRALALIEIDQYALSSKEFRRFIYRLSPERVANLMTYAHHLGQADLTYRLGIQIFRKHGRRFDWALYPVPRWQPTTGFQVEPALLYAFIRQESAFKPYAKSRVGARGLMQLMPRTARYVANKPMPLHELHKPENNMALGQKYLQFLMNDHNIGKNLVFTTASYNGGPGNVLRWVAKGKRYRNDPLLFIETIPLKETRHFVKKVLSNYWVYQHRLGEDTPSRLSLAMGRWPLYGKPVPYPQDLVHKYGRLR